MDKYDRMTFVFVVESDFRSRNNLLCKVVGGVNSIKNGATDGFASVHRATSVGVGWFKKELGALSPEFVGVFKICKTMGFEKCFL